jgi:NIPSNAP.
MTVYLERTYVVKPEKLKEHNQWGKKLVALMKKKPDLFRGVKSLRVLKHRDENRFTALWGFKNLDAVEGWEKGFTEIPEQKALRAEFMDLIVEGSFSVCVLDSVKTVTRKRKKKHQK